MARLTAAKRNALPSSEFAIPSERKYPMPDKAHAANAKARASQFASPAVKATVDRKADRVLGKHPHKNLGGYLHPKKSK